MKILRKKNGEFFRKIMVLLVIIFFVIVAAFSLIICNSFMLENEQKMQESVDREAQQNCIANEKILGEVLTQMKLLMNLDLFHAVYDTAVSERLYYNLCSEIVEYLKNITNVNTDIDSIYFYGEGKEEIITDSGTVGYDLFTDKSWKTEYEKMNGEELKAFFRNGTTSNKVFTLLYKKSVGNSDSCIVINIDTKKLFASISKKGFLAIVDNNTNKLVCISNEKNRGAGESVLNVKESDIVRFEKNHYIVVKKHSDYGKFSYVYSEIYPEYMSDNIRILVQMGAIVILMLAFFIMIAFWIAGYTYKPIKDLGEITDNPDLLKSRKYLENDENTKKIAEKILNVVYRDENLCRELNEKMENFNYAQLKALQWQINPHFIFNTLNVFYLFSENITEKSAEISEGLLLFSKIMRYTLKTEPMLVPLSEELTLANDYIRIMGIRLENNFDFEISCDESLKKRPVIKMCIQPLLENIFKYGIKNIERRVHIKIDISDCGEAVKLVVSDNGSGMTEERLAEIKDRLSKKPDISDTHIGLMNINSRLVLMYGEEYSLVVESSPGAGTRVSMLCPQKTKGLKNDLKDTKSH